MGRWVLRGGAWDNNDNDARSSNRNNNQPDNRNNNIGFRCAQQSFYSMCPRAVWRGVNGRNVARFCLVLTRAGGWPEPTGECTPALFPGRRQRWPKNKRIAPTGRHN